MAPNADKPGGSGEIEPGRAASPSATPLKGRDRAVEFARRLARPISQRTERRRQKIFEDAIAAAQTIAREEGLEGLTARRVARSIGCSVGTLYNVFDNLDELILHLNGATIDALYEEFLALELPPDGERAIRRIIEAYLEFVRNNDGLWHVIFDHAWPKDYPISRVVHGKNSPPARICCQGDHAAVPTRQKGGVFSGRGRIVERLTRSLLSRQHGQAWNCHRRSRQCSNR